MKFSAHVKDGQIVPDEPIALFDGEAVEVSTADGGDRDVDGDDDNEMTADEREELDAALTESREQFKRGEFVNAREAVLKLASRL
ncbi:MAG TPA: hypothetical protein VFP84_10470 [Kofleriaceae bacterium]|nr:hypothetical protein [Kofleriaceae bacterium]